MILSTVLFNALGLGPKDQRYRDGYHATSSHWQAFKMTLPSLTPYQTSAAIGMALGDAGLSKANKEASMKVEQGYQQFAFVQYLFELFASHCFMVEPGVRMEPTGSSREGLPKSYWFRTFAIPQFTFLYDLFYVKGVKVILPGLVMEHVDAVALAFWVMCDASLKHSSLTLHSQSFTEAESRILSDELNLKFGLHSKVIPHKRIYHVITFPAGDGPVLRKLIGPHVIPSLQYKVPS